MSSEMELSKVVIHGGDDDPTNKESFSPVLTTSRSTPKDYKSVDAIDHSEKEKLTEKNEEEPFLLSIGRLADKYQTDINRENVKNSVGLTSLEAGKRLERDGANELTPPKEQSEIVRLLKKFLDPFFIFLAVASLFSLIAYLADRNSSNAPLYWQIAVVLIGAVIISALFAYWQEGKASSAMKSFKKLMPASATVIRDGTQQKIPARDLVVGDIVLLSGGDRTPADIRVIFAAESKQDKAALTGEALPVIITSAPDNRAEKIEDASNICFNSCPIVEGQIIGVVIGTGDGTVIGRIANLASQTTIQETPIQREVKSFVKKLSVLAFILAVIFFIIAMARGKSFLYSFVNVFVVIMISVIPEGLPLTVTSCLAVTAKKMSEKNIFVKELRSVETLGSATVIASDKTGTLTQNVMTVMQLWCDLMPMNAQQVMHDAPLPIFEANHSLAAPPTTDEHEPNTPLIGEKKRIERTANAPNTGVSAYGLGGVSSIGMNLLELIMTCCNRGKYDDDKPLSDDDAQAFLQKQIASQLTQLTNPHIAIEALKSANPALYSLINQSLDPTKTLRSALSYQMMNEGERQRNRKIIADASEKALLEFIINRGQSIELYRYFNPIVYEVPFNSRNKFALTITKSYKKIGQTQARRLLMKGAPEIVLSKCSYYVARDEVFPIDNAFRSRFQSAYEYFGGQGMRVLGYAFNELDEQRFPPSFDKEYNFEKGNFPTNGLIFVGLTALADPPKPGVDKAVASCKTAGIKVMMVTGDHALTAESIARTIGLIDRSSVTRRQAAQTRNCSESEVITDEYQAVVVEGSDLMHYNDTDWDRLFLKSEIVFARTTPIQKLQIVEQLQKRGEIVAVTGDGVNDSPALKAANIGVAMGIGGSDVARDAADVIIMDDNFASIVEGVRFGRAIFDNLTKVVCYTVTHLVPETVPTLLAIAFDFPSALPSLAIIAIDLGSEMPAAISFAWEPPEGDVMSEKPRDPRASHLFTIKTLVYTILVAGALETLVCYLGWLLVWDHYGVSPNQLAWTSGNYWSSGSNNWPAGCIANSPGCYNDKQQVQILWEAGGCFWFLLVAGQFSHLFMSKTRRMSLFSVGIFNNAVMVLAAFTSALLAMLFIWTPKMNEVLVGKPFPGQFWAIAVLIWGLMLIMSEGRKWVGRKYPKGWFHRYINY